VHASTNIVVALSAPVDWLPEGPFEPVHPPEAVHELALADDQVSVELAPAFTVVGFADNITVGGGGAPITVTVTLRCALPPSPVHCRVKVVLFVRLLIAWLPEVCRFPVQPPDAVQAVAFVDDQVSWVLPPLATLVGLAFNVTVGADGCWAETVTVTESMAVPPSPVQVRLKVALAFSAPVLWEPVVGLSPLHAPDPVQDAAFELDHDNMVELPGVIETEAAVRSTVGWVAVSSSSSELLQPAVSATRRPSIPKRVTACM
jgi:hypothetical protein